MRFQNKVVVVAGSGTGIGRATASLLASEGALVVVVDIAADHAEETVARIKQSGGQATAVIADVSNSAEASTIPQAALDTFGAIHYIVNSVGIQTYGTVIETDEGLWDRTLNVNLKSQFLMCHYCLPEIIRQGRGAVVNVASVQGHTSSQKGVTAYATSKAGVVALSRCMSLDYADQGIRVNCVLPGSVDTPLLRAGAAVSAVDGDIQAVIDSWGMLHPIGRIGQAGEIAELIAFLLSDAASFITGSTITIDGGLTTKLV